MIFFAFSLTPSLLPRADVVQGIISGLSLAAGYTVGVAGVWIWQYLDLPTLKKKTQYITKATVAIGGGGLALLFLWQATGWQNSIRSLMGMQPTTPVHPFVVGFVTLIIFLLAILFGKLVHRIYLFITGYLQNHIPRKISNLVGFFLVIIILWITVSGLLFSLVLRSYDLTYQQYDALVQPEHEPPQLAEVSGSPQSLLTWEEMGRQGRNFLVDRPTAGKINNLTENEAREPIRVYVGLNAARSTEERAELALEELKRTGAFDRSVLVLATPTGTGMIDENAITPLEYLHRGDVATVAAQYSYLPSHVALIAEGEYGTEMARAVFNKIYEHWSALPADSRPELYLYGLSLGALNSERSFDLYDIINDPFQGVLWSGPPYRMATWREVTTHRDAGTPFWLPEFRGGEVVRFANQSSRLADYEGEWGDFRIAFLQYASDPITFFSPEIFYRQPKWLDEPRGPDVVDELRWFPIVTGLQLAADMAWGSAPPGYGHNFAMKDYLWTWYDLTEPEGWTESELKKLQGKLKNNGDGADYEH